METANKVLGIMRFDATAVGMSLMSVGEKDLKKTLIAHRKGLITLSGKDIRDIREELANRLIEKNLLR